MPTGPEHWLAVERLFLAAIDRPVGQRAAFVDSATVSPEVRRAVQELIARDADAAAFLERPAAALAAEQLGLGTPVPPFHLGGYEVIDRLGVGGMGCVYRARDLRLHRQVALKLLPGHLAADTAARERLHHEALAAAALDHPFICKVYDVAEHEGEAFIVMEMIEGQTLASRLRHPVERSEAFRIAGEVAEALEAAHARGIVHRDLTPSNVMLTAGGRVKVLDFGLAKRLEHVWGNTGAPPPGSQDRYGTPAYMAPEQIAGEHPDARADIFAFGIILCELAGRRHPFRRATVAQTLAAIAGDPPDLADDRAPLPVLLCQLLDRLLAKCADDRPQTMAEVRQALQHAAAAAPGPGHGPPAAAPGQLPLVERDPEMRMLMRQLTSALAGSGSVVLIGGEPGIGKTRLAQALLEQAAALDAVALVGHCREAGGSVPYAAFVDVLERLFERLGESTARAVLGESLPEIARLMPTATRRFGEPAPVTEFPLHQERRLLFNAFLDVLRRLGRLAPQVFVVEDIQWADEPTLLLLQHVAEAAPGLPLLVIGTHRDGDIDLSRAFVRTLDRIVRERLARRLTLHRLTMPAVESLLTSMSGRRPPDRLTRTIYQHTEGNPFFVAEVFQHLHEEGRLFAADGTWRTNLELSDIRIPDGVRVVLRHRLDRLRPSTIRVLTVASLIGQSFGTNLLEHVCGVTGDAVADAIEQAEAARLVEAEGASREPRYRFLHALVRRALSDRISLPRRQHIHARLAAAIEQLHAGRVDKQAPVIAHHLLAAGAAADQASTLVYLTLAAEQARRAAAFEEALGYFDAALALIDDDDSPVAAGLHEGRADVLRSLGRFAPAVAAYDRAIELYDAAGDQARLAAATYPLTLIHAWNADARRHLSVTTRALDRLSDAAPELRARVLFLHALALSASGDAEGALAAIAEARGLASRVHDPVLELTGAVQEVHVSYHAMQIPQARAASERAMRLCRQARDVWGCVDMDWHQVMATIYAARPLQARKMIDQARVQAEQVGHHNVLWFYRLLEGVLALAAGDFKGAEEHACAALTLGDLYGIPWNFSSELTLGQIALYSGRDDDAIQHLRRAVALEPDSYWTGVSRAALFAALAQARQTEAMTALQECPPQLPVANRANVFGRWVNLTYVIEGLAWADRLDDAAALHAQAESLIATGVQCFRDMRLYRTSAAIAAACAGDWRRSDEHFDAAIALAQAAPLPIAEAQAHFWRGRLLLRHGDRTDDAHGWLRGALRRFDDLRMSGYAAAAARLLAHGR
ncbi:MAG TPA: protein kinase [Vicinamibacterales bacterium]|nr:protein kinase [Vicinamibacterales bacterium]